MFTKYSTINISVSLFSVHISGLSQRAHDVGRLRVQKLIVV